MSTCLQGKNKAFFPGFNSLSELFRYAGRDFVFNLTEDSTSASFFIRGLIITTNIPGKNTDVHIRSARLPQPQWKIELYPNPATDFIKVTVLSPLKNTLQVELLDLLGNRIQEQRILLNQFAVFNLSDLTPSIYFLRITDTGKKISITRKVTKIN